MVKQALQTCHAWPHDIMRNLDKWIETMSGINHTVSRCLQIEDIGNVHKMMIYKITQECISGYQCIKVYIPTIIYSFPTDRTQSDVLPSFLSNDTG